MSRYSVRNRQTRGNATAIETGVSKIHFPFAVDSGLTVIALVQDADDAERIKTALDVLDVLEQSKTSSTRQLKSHNFASRLTTQPSRFQSLEQRLRNNTFVASEGSSWIATISYDGKSQTLRLNKKDGDSITHINVPPDTAMKVIQPGMLEGFSHGTAYNLLVRGKFDSVSGRTS